MNGYLLAIYGGDDAQEVPHVGVPGQSPYLVCQEAGVSLIGWGAEGSGDIQVVKGDGSVLIVQGYVSAAPRISEFRCRRFVGEQLRKQIRNATSLREMVSLGSALNGAFSIVHIDLGRRSVDVLIDRLGTRPVWMGHSPNAFHLSSHSLAIAQAGNLRQHNVAVLASVLLYGALVDPNEGLFRGVSSQPAGTVSTYNSAGLVDCASYYSFAHRPENRSRKEWTRLAASGLRNAAQRGIDVWGEPVLFLSGGVDSRLVGSALASVGCKPPTVTLGDSRNVETRVAERVAASLGTRHKLHLRDRHYYLRELQRTVFESGGRYRWRHSHFGPAYSDVLTERPEATAYLGDFAEAFSKLFCEVQPGRTKGLTEEEFSHRFDSLHLPTYRPHNRARTLRLLQPDVAHQALQELDDSVRARFRRLQPAAADPRILSDLFFRWADASTLPTFQMFLDVRSVGPERNVMHDTEVHSLLEVLPSAIRDSAGFGAGLISELYPAAGLVPDSNTLLPLVVPRPLHRLSKRLRPLLGKARRALGANTYRTTGSWSLLTLLYAVEPLWRTRFESILLNERLFDSRIFNIAEISSAWDAFVAGDHEHYQDIETLLSFGMISQWVNDYQEAPATTLQPA